MRRNGKRGWTLMEMLAVIAIVALLSAVAIPSMLWIRDSLLFQQRNAHARTIFLAAQARLTQMRTTGDLEFLPPCDPAVPQRDDTAALPDRVVYTFAGEEAFGAILPDGVLEDAIRETGILIEFDPLGGAVLGVFYSDGEADLAGAYASGSLPRQPDARRARLLGYYDGSGPENERLNVYTVAAELSYIDGDAFSVTVMIPTQTWINGQPQDITAGNLDAFQRNLEVKLILTGARGGTEERIIKARGTAAGSAVLPDSGGGNAVWVTVELDSLEAGFADGPDILPGDNVTITAVADVRSAGEGPVVLIENAVMASVNPMFASLTDGKHGQVLALSNARHLRNLNRVCPEIALDVDTVLFTSDGGDGEGKHRGIDLDLKDIPMEPIANPYLFGTAAFTETGLDEDPVREASAKILGNGTVICNLCLAETEGFVGLFAYTNGSVEGLFLENPQIQGHGARAVGALLGAAGEDAVITNCGVYVEAENFRMEDFSGGRGQFGISGSGAVGGLIGYAESARKQGANIADCFGAVPVLGYLSGADGFTAGAGGLVGNAQSCRFKNCYASGWVTAQGCLGEQTIPWENNYLGLTESGATARGAGGFVGNAHGCRFEKCFATGNVQADAASAGAFVGVMCYDNCIDTQKTKFISCYAVGDAVFDGCWGYFSGVNAVLGEAPQAAPGTSAEGVLYKNCYYLSKYPKAPECSNIASIYCAKPVTYDALQYQTAGKAAGFAAGWGTATAARTRSYGNQQGNYPFFLQDGLIYYGNWPKEQAEAILVYWETYENCKEPGYYLEGQGTENLRQDAVVLKDGYGLLASHGAVSVTVDGEAVSLTRERKRVQLGQDAYYVYCLPELETPEDFYSEVTVTAGGQSKTIYVSPNIPMSQTSPKPDTIPQTIPLRSARQLAALGEYPYFRDASYVQQLDMDFSTLGHSHKPIEAFAGRYDGRGKSISGLTTWLFASIGETGVVENVHLRGNGPLAKISAGSIANCSVDADLVAEADGYTGLLAGEMNGGSIENCTATGSIAGDAQTGAIGGAVGRMTAGTVCLTEADVALSGSSGTVGSFVGIAAGGSFRDCRVTAEYDGHLFAGSAVETASAPIREDATHYSFDLFTETRCTAEEYAVFQQVQGDSHKKSTYASTFENCTYQLAGEQVDVMRKTYYYRLEALGGIRAVQQVGDPIPESGQYLLMTGDGKLLCVTEGGSVVLEDYQAGRHLEDGMLWQAGETQWVNCCRPTLRTEQTHGDAVTTVTETTYTVTAELTPNSSGEGASMQVSYMVTAEIKQTVTTGQQELEISQYTKTEASGTALCDLYTAQAQDAYQVIYVDEGYGLAQPDGQS